MVGYCQDVTTGPSILVIEGWFQEPSLTVGLLPRIAFATYQHTIAHYQRATEIDVSLDSVTRCTHRSLTQLLRQISVTQSAPVAVTRSWVTTVSVSSTLSIAFSFCNR